MISGGSQVLRLHLAQRHDVALVLRVEGGRGFGHGELGAHRAGQVGVRRLPGLGARVEEDRRPELGQRRRRLALQQVGHLVEIDAPDLRQGNGERVGGTR